MLVLLGDVATQTAPQGRVNLAWAVSFLLAAAVLFVVWRTVPGAEKLILGKDGRASTSKFSATAWTLAVAFALFSLFFGYLIYQLGNWIDWAYIKEMRVPLGESLDKVLGEGLDETYLLLLGLPLGTAVACKGITAGKVASGSIVKTEKDPAGAGTSLTQELVGDDSGDTDLGDFQYLLFNLLALGYFLVGFFTHPALGLPNLPDSLFALTGVSAAAYIGKKGIYREPPTLLGVLPPAAKPGEKIRIYGQHLLAAPAPAQAGGAPAPAADPQLGTIVTIAGQAVALDGTPGEELVTAVVPEMAAGPTTLKVLRPPGASSEELPFTVLAK